MARPLDSKELALFARPPLLTTESEKDFACLSAALEQDIEPRGVVERMYVADIAALVWEILRFRRCKVAIVNAAFRDALYRILEDLTNADQDTQFALISDWFKDPMAKGVVSEILAEYHLDESAIEAEAFRQCAKDLEWFDRSLALAEVRRDKALRCIADYRQNLANQLQQAASRILADDDVPRLVAAGKRSD
jgi:hypothetical protein